jgi:hypothetical protein
MKLLLYKSAGLIYPFFVMRNETINKYLVSYCPIAGSTRRSGRFFPRSHEGLEAAIKLADRVDADVTLGDLVIWSHEDK